MKNNKGVTLVNMVIIIIVIIIISSVSIIGGRGILENAKDSNKEENLAAVQSAVYNINTKLGTAGVFSPANTKLYGKSAVGVLSGDESTLNDWYILDEEDLEELGITYIDEIYLVNYKMNKVISMSEYEEKGLPVIDENSGE